MKKLIAGVVIAAISLSLFSYSKASLSQSATAAKENKSIPAPPAM